MSVMNCELKLIKSGMSFLEFDNLAEAHRVTNKMVSTYRDEGVLVEELSDSLVPAMHFFVSIYVSGTS